METIGNDYLVNISNIFECKICNYVASRKYNLEIHNNGIKHKNLVLKINEDEKLVKLSKTSKGSKKYECESCEKQYTNKSGLWKHKKKCIDEIGLADLKNDLANEKQQQQLVEYLLKENSEFKQLMMDQNNKIMELTNSILKSI